MAIKQRYNPTVFAYVEAQGIDEILKNGQSIRVGDRYFELIHCPVHSSDSICLYVRAKVCYVI